MEMPGTTRTGLYRSLFKLSILIIYGSVVFGISLYSYKQRQLSLEQASRKRVLLVSFPYEKANVRGYGEVIEPRVRVDLRYPQGYRKTSFVLDSGALISSLPMEVARDLKVNLAFLPRQQFVGFGNSLSYAYRGQITLRLNDKKTVNLPVVFTENENTEYLLGRYGFFDDYSVDFNHIQQTVDIYQ